VQFQKYEHFLQEENRLVRNANAILQNRRISRNRALNEPDILLCFLGASIHGQEKSNVVPFSHRNQWFDVFFEQSSSHGDTVQYDPERLRKQSFVIRLFYQTRFRLEAKKTNNFVMSRISHASGPVSRKAGFWKVSTKNRGIGACHH
jgi:hypothetical protein